MDRLTDEQAKQVTFIHNAARELTEMVNDLLDMAKVEAGKIDIHIIGIRPGRSTGNASRHDAAIEHEPQRAAHFRGKRDRCRTCSRMRRRSLRFSATLSRTRSSSPNAEKSASAASMIRKYDTISLPWRIRESAFRPRNRTGFSNSIIRSIAQDNGR